MNRAINASLDVMKEKEKEDKALKEEKTVDKVVRDEDNFPSLGAVKPEQCSNCPAESEYKDGGSGQEDFNMAKQIALKNKRSVQYGRLISNEFPTLSGDTPSMSRPTEITDQKDKPSSVPVTSSQVVSKTTTKPTPKYTSTVSKGSLHSEDFPGLPTKSSTQSAIGSASWVSKQPKKESKQAAAMPIQATVNKTNNNTKTKGSKILKAFNDTNDFPALGGKPTQPLDTNINWLQKSAKEKGKSKSEKKSIDWFDADDGFKYSIDNVTKISQNKSKDEKKTSNNNDSKKKKKKKDTNKSSDNSSPTISLVSGSSLDSIASSLLGNNSDKKPVKVDSPKPEKKVVVERTESPVTFQTVDKKAKSCPVPSIDNKFSVLNDDVETETCLVPEPEHFKPSKKKSMTLKPDDFPALGSTKSSQAPPPGFAKPLVVTSDTKNPPGFPDGSSGKRPPPGFSSMPQTSQENGHVDPEEKKCTFTLKNIMPMMSEINNFEYVSVQNSNVRNKQLIQDILTHLGDSQESFDEFKSVSAAFRQGDTDAMTYYNTCEKLIGKDNFNNIFPELLVLLPNINKQQELLSTYRTHQDKSKSDKVIRISGKSAQAPWSSTFQSCPTCRQVLLSSDVSEHTIVHDNTSDFPSLSGGGGPGLRAWVKGK